MPGWALELIGYAASVLVAISLTMSSIVRLRVINLLGSVVFTVYGVLIAAYPVAVVNLFIVFVNLYYLRGMARTREYFHLLEVRPDSEYLHHFLDHYGDGIRRYLPGFSGVPSGPVLAVFVLRDLVPAGLLLGTVRGRTLRVELDFVIPRYRDFKVGDYLFREQAGFLRDRGIREILAGAGSAEHTAYLRRMGFAPTDHRDGGEPLYRLPLG